MRQLVSGETATDTVLDPYPLAGLVLRSDRILSEDPTIPVLLGQRPVLVDPFTARLALAEHPEWARALAQRISAKEFDKIILVNGLAPGSSAYPDQFLGRTVNDAVVANYRTIYAEVNLYVNVPNGQGG
jgi:hypothetical protein